MYPSDEFVRIVSIKNKIENIFAIIKRHKNITNALNDIEGQPTILMLLVSISEQFAKLKEKNSKILENFDIEDIKGLTSIRNFIAHDYDGVNLSIIEDDLRENMPRILEIIKEMVEG